MTLLTLSRCCCTHFNFLFCWLLLHIRMWFSWFIECPSYSVGRRFVWLCCGAENVWAVDHRGQVYMRIGVTAPVNQLLNPAWVPVDGAPQTIGARFVKVMTASNDWMVSLYFKQTHSYQWDKSFSWRLNLYAKYSFFSCFYSNNIKFW